MIAATSKPAAGSPRNPSPARNSRTGSIQQHAHMRILTVLLAVAALAAAPPMWMKDGLERLVTQRRFSVIDRAIERIRRFLLEHEHVRLELRWSPGLPREAALVMVSNHTPWLVFATGRAERGR